MSASPTSPEPPPGRPRVTLILLGHGSHLNPDSSAPVYAHAERIRATGRFDQVLEAFWKEEPSLRDAIDLAEAERVIIVPLFLAEGYFTREVLPRELGLAGPTTARDGRAVIYTAPVGTHRAMAGMIASRAREVLRAGDGGGDDAALVIIGHGTERSPTSGDTVYRLADEIRGRGEFGEVACGFLDEAPDIAEVLGAVRSRSVVLVPFFVAEGWHTRETIPADLGLTGEVTRRGDRTIWYTPPVGTLPGMADVVMELALDSDATSAEPAGPVEVGGRDGPRELAEARADLLARLDADGELILMQLAIRRSAPGRYEVRHVAERTLRPPEAHPRPPEAPPHRPDGAEGPAPGGRLDPSRTGAAEARLDPDPETRILRFARHAGDAAALRRTALDIARFSETGAYRPLRSAPGLRGGWIFADLDAEQLWELLSVIYPAAVLHAHRRARGTLEIVDFAPWAARQTAMYAGLRELAPEAVARLTRSLCGPCRRHRLWRIDAGDAPGLSATGANELAVPCREPCTVFATEARELPPGPGR